MAKPEPKPKPKKAGTPMSEIILDQIFGSPKKPKPPKRR
jgi:hypothetical protein